VRKQQHLQFDGRRLLTFKPVRNVNDFAGSGGRAAFTADANAIREQVSPSRVMPNENGPPQGSPYKSRDNTITTLIRFESQSLNASSSRWADYSSISHFGHDQPTGNTHS